MKFQEIITIDVFSNLISEEELKCTYWGGETDSQETKESIDRLYKNIISILDNHEEEI